MKRDIIDSIIEDYCGDCENQPFARQGADCWKKCDDFRFIYEDIKAEAESQTEKEK